MQAALPALAIVLLGLTPAPSFALDGETDGAYVQNYDWEKQSDGTTNFVVLVKIRKPGLYVVGAGFTKRGKLHKGAVYGTKYYGTSQVQGEAGDQIRVAIKNVPHPPWNREVSAGVYDGESDIKTGG